MSRKRPTWLLALAALVGIGCGAADGGPVGTGIAASVIGNVVAVEDPGGLFASAAGAPSLARDGEDVAFPTGAGGEPELGDEADGAGEADGFARAATVAPAAQIGGIEVGLVEFPEIATRTAADGSFTLEGDFAGPVTLRFATADFDVEQPLVIPSGGVLLLSDIQLEESGVTVEAGRQLGLTGEVRSVDCGGGRIVVDDRSPAAGTFEITLLPETGFTRDGEPVSCDDVRVGGTIQVDGLVDRLDQSSVTALQVEVAPGDDPPPPEPFRQVAFLGYVAARNCNTGVVTVDNERHRFRVLLGPESEIVRDDGRPFECRRLKLGMRVTGRGRLELRHPAILTAIRMIVSSATAPAVELRIRGFVASRECDRKVLQIGYPESVIAVRLTPDTVVMPPRPCKRIPVGILVRGRGVASQRIPGAIDAIELKLVRVKD